MTATTETNSFDWEAFWRDADESDRASANASRHYALDVVPAFLEERGVPDAFADVGCGSGLVAFAVAERYPDTTVVGYDTADAVLAENRERARDRGLDNLGFEHATLPAFDPGREYDAVFCFTTLGYVREIEAALGNLYDAVAFEGDLLFTYPNWLTQSHFRALAEAAAADDAGTDGGAGAEAGGEAGSEAGGDADAEADRRGDQRSDHERDRSYERVVTEFGPVLEGVNLLSYDRIHEVLGSWPQSAWSIGPRPDVRWAWRHHPLVFVPK